MARKTLTTYNPCDSHNKGDLILPLLQLVIKVWLLRSVFEGIWGKQCQGPFSVPSSLSLLQKQWDNFFQ